MANLSLPELEVRITADGSAAIQEIERTADAAEEMAGAANRGASGAAEGFDALGGAAQRTGGNLRDAGRSAQEFSQQTETAMRRASVNVQELGQQMSSIGKGMTMALTVPIVGALAASVKGASDMTETLGKTDVVFGAMAEHVRAWSESSVSAMGLAQQTALDMAATYGDMATGMGMTQTEAANMSTSLVKLAADMASFKNISISDVNTALTAVFTGETESLKRLGIVMTQTNLQQFAYSQGIQKNIADMTQAEQVQLRYQYVMAMSANAQGDFQRTGGNLANQTRALGETVKQAGTAFGELLVPAVTKVVSALRDGAQWLSELDDGTKRTILTIAMVVAAVGPLLLVGGKVISMITSIQGAIATMSLNPVFLGLAAATAAIAAAVGAAKLLDKGVDTASDSYKQLKATVEGGAHGELTIDSSDIDELNEDPPTITIDANGQAALDEAQSIVDELTSGKYDGELAIDGDPAAAQAALGELKAAIEGAKAALTIDADGNAVLGPGGELDRLRAAIEKCKAIVAVTTDPEAKAALEAELSELMAQFETLNVSVTVDDQGSAALDSLTEKLEVLPRDQTYKNTGEFVISDATPEVIESYAEALTKAATATDDYASAVDNLNAIVDQENQRAIGEVQTQMTEASRELAAQLNSGIISEQEYNERSRAIYDDGMARIRQIEAETEARKQLNEQYNNGSLEDDPVAYAAMMREVYKGETVSQTQGQTAAAAVITGEYDDDAVQRRIASETAVAALRQQGIEQQEQLNAAVEQYNQAMAAADNTEQFGAAEAQESLERAKILQEAVAQYGTLITNGVDPAEAVRQVTEQFSERMAAYEGLEEGLEKTLAGEDGKGLDYAGVIEKGAMFEQMIGDYQAEIDGVAQEAEQSRERAREQFGQALSGIVGDYSSAELDAELSAMEAAGAQVTEVDRQLIVGATKMAEDVSAAIESGDSGQIDAAIENMFEGADAEGIGNNLAQGLIDGMTDGIEGVRSAAQGMGEAAVDGADTGAGTHSPSTKTAETGRNLIAGLVEGMRDTSGVSTAAQAAGAAAVAAIQEAIASVDGGEGASLGEALLGGVAEGASSGGNVSSALGSTIRSAVSACASIASSGGRSIGTNLVAGARSGVMSAASSLASAAANAVRSAIAAAKSAASIHSPSGVMRDEVGVQLMRGMEVGVQERTPTTIERIRESVSGVLSGAAQVITTGNIPAPALAIPAPAGVSFDYERLADAVSERPISFRVGGKQLAAATRDEAARQQAVRVQQINSGYGGR